MTNESASESADGVKPEDLKKDQTGSHADPKGLTEQSSSSLRKAGLSKREIMEELSRERFPWEE
jgi:hypothetical protein